MRQTASQRVSLELLPQYYHDAISLQLLVVQGGDGQRSAEPKLDVDQPPDYIRQLVTGHIRVETRERIGVPVAC
jgi:hypothetical protein